MLVGSPQASESRVFRAEARLGPRQGAGTLGSSGWGLALILGGRGGIRAELGLGVPRWGRRALPRGVSVRALGRMCSTPRRDADRPFSMLASRRHVPLDFPADFSVLDTLPERRGGRLGGGCHLARFRLTTRIQALVARYRYDAAIPSPSQSESGGWVRSRSILSFVENGRITRR